MHEPRRCLFVYTNSFDLSVDVIIKRLGNDAVFRFNLDLWKDYKVEITGRGLLITNAAGRSVESKDIAKFLWRKPLTHQHLYPDQSFPTALVFEEEELAYAMREVWNAMYLDGRAVLIDPLSDAIAGKLIQANLARRYFPVPEWAVVSGKSGGGIVGTDAVAKSLTSLRTGDRSVLFTTRVDVENLSPASPWFLQAQVPADADVTVVFIRGRSFAFAFNRAELPAGVLDWGHARILNPSQQWVPHPLPATMTESILKFMEDMSLHYGRLDFLVKQGTYHFLEVNPNGEWGWLDAPAQGGILNALVEELSPETPCHPLPHPRIIRHDR